MTVDEIRAELAFAHPIEHILTEIAAQLAELNEILRGQYCNKCGKSLASGCDCGKPEQS